MNEPLLDESEPQPQPAAPLGKVVLVNFLIILLYSALQNLPANWGIKQHLIPLFLFVLLQMFANIALGVVFLFLPKYRSLASVLIFSGVLIGLIGYGTCMVGYLFFS
ncbi:MAG TPA: hypothetical protein VK168_20235 [Saprospiraceae bacterium]|nr:hypothetical protein [Saprospiraceae bacterium]